VGFDRTELSRAGLAVAIAVLMGLAGCAELAPGAAPVAAVPAAPMDPLAAFVASSPPGARGMVVLADGSRVPARVMRGYVSANGRECREVMLGSGGGERSSLICQGDEAAGGAWVVARPLLNSAYGGGYAGGYRP